MDDFERPKTHVQWMLGNKCNYNCSYCLDLLKRGDYQPPDEEVFLEVCKDITYHYDDLNRDVVFEFIGGEPTLVDKIPEIGNRLHNFPTNIILKTNGSAGIDWWKLCSKYLSEVVISVHREFADIDHIINVVELLQQSKLIHPIKIRVLFPVTVRPESFEWGVKQMKKFKKRFGLGELQLLYSNFGKGSDMFLPYKAEQLAITNQNLPEIVPSNPIKNFSFKGKTCYAGLETLIIDAIGDVYRGWCLEGGKIGNIYQMPVMWPKDTIVCSKDFCKNGFDQISRKE